MWSTFRPICGKARSSAENWFPRPHANPRVPPPLSFDGLEKQVVQQTLTHNGGNLVRAAPLLGISRDKLRYKVKKHNPQNRMVP
jgi:DNA-binding NtrC family response regulator